MQEYLIQDIVLNSKLQIAYWKFSFQRFDSYDFAGASYA